MYSIVLLMYLSKRNFRSGSFTISSLVTTNTVESNILSDLNSASPLESNHVTSKVEISLSLTDWSLIKVAVGDFGVAREKIKIGVQRYR